MSSALNGITAYEDDDEKRIRNEDIVKINNEDLKLSIIRVKNLVESKMNEIVDFINNIPSDFKESEIISDIRKEYYIKTFKMRFKLIL